MKRKIASGILPVMLVLAALMPMVIKPAAAGEPISTDWIPDQMVSDDYTNLDHRPSIASDRLGNLYVAYEHLNPTTKRYEIKVAKSTDGGISWSIIHTRSSSYNFYYDPKIAIDTRHNYIYVVYERLYYTAADTDIYLDRYVDGTWYLEYIDTDSNEYYSPSITVDSYSERIYVAYERRIDIDKDIMFTTSTNHGDTWTTPIVVVDSTWQSTQPIITSFDDYGHVYLTYREQFTIMGLTTKRIMCGRAYGFEATDKTKWTHKIAAFVFDPADVENPAIAVSRRGGVVVVAYDYRSSSTDDWDIRYVYSINYGDYWSDQRVMVDSSADERWPSLTVDGMNSYDFYLGDIHLVYTKKETLGDPIPYRVNGVYYKKTNIGTPYNWPYYHPQIADSTARVVWETGVLKGQAAITTVRDNVPVVVFADYRAGNRDIYATTLGGKYTIDTSPSGLRVSVDGVDYMAPVSFYWPLKTFHWLDVASTQGPHSFVKWSDWGSRSHGITTTTLSEELIVAYYTPKLTLSLSSTTVPRGSKLTLSGQLTPAYTTTIRLYYRYPHITGSWILLTTLPTNTAGAYSYTFTVPTSIPAGEYDLATVWFYPSTGAYAASNVRTVTVT